jgi:phosphatidylserine/phosphatidylglycerophosphate/cardiolipin synthase-like enzyme
MISRVADGEVKGGGEPETGRAKRPADAIPGLAPLPKLLEEAGVKVGSALGEGIDRAVRNRHRGRLRRAGWEHALDADGLEFATGGAPPRPGNAIEILIDGCDALQRIAEELQRARSHVHLTGWFLSPNLHLTREDEPVVVRNLLAELAQKIDVRVLLWEGAPVPVFRPSRADVRRASESLTRHTNISCALDSCTGLSHCHHEKTIVIDDRVAFVGGIDLTLDGGDPFDTQNHNARGGVGWHDATARIEGPAVADVAEHFRLRWRAPGREALPIPEVAEPGGDLEVQVVRTVPAKRYRALPGGDYSVLSSYMGALRAAERLIYLENQFLWSPEVVEVLAGKLREPPHDDFRLVVLLPARANDGADVSRGQVSALIQADDGAGRFLACTVYARTGFLRDIVYVHAKIGIVDDRWLTIGSANLNSHSLFHDTEMNVVSLDPELARATRLRLWSEHLEVEPDEIDGDPARVVDERWIPIAEEQLERLGRDEALTHRLVLLPGVSRRRRRLLGPIQSQVLDV